jgi:hypothetical protein
VGRIRRYIECDNAVLLAIELEFGRIVAFVAVEDQQPIFTLRPRRYIVVEVLDLIEAYYISSLAVVGSCDTPVG